MSILDIDKLNIINLGLESFSKKAGCSSSTY